MPCESGPSYDNYTEDRLRGRLDTLTWIACEMGKELSKCGMTGRLTKHTQAWIKRHEVADRKRIAREKAERKAEAEQKAARKSALGKLSKRERQALGLEKD